MSVPITNTSKIVLVKLLEYLQHYGFVLLDYQQADVPPYEALISGF
ncbi:MAG: hypothetical protein U9Q61_05410 [Thermodesulfobacteriota bacterium]|nr:hypothetical protein [Thermodesulfobacteriota bacterium]